MDVKFANGLSTTFLEKRVRNSLMGMYGISEDRQYAVKFEFLTDPEKKHDLRREAGIIKMLNDRKCRTCVELVHFAEIPGEALVEHFPSTVALALEFDVERSYPMMITRAYTKMVPVYTQDLTMAIIEQKKLGVWNGDITVDDILLDTRENCIKLVDYDQAVLLDDEKIQMGNTEFFDWLDEDAASRHPGQDVSTFIHNLDVTRETHIAPFFDGDSFNIGRTLLFSAPETSSHDNKIDQSFRTRDVHAVAGASFDDCIELLDKLDFFPGEQVLDVGCNAGLLCHYLFDRGCTVHGIDIDPQVIAGAKILANIADKPDIEFSQFTLDNSGLIGHFDTVLLFSIIHRTRRVVETAGQIAKICNRIVIKCRLSERGEKPDKGVWVEASMWQHETVAELIAALEILFPGFHHCATLGQIDDEQYMLELKKTRSDDS